MPSSPTIETSELYEEMWADVRPESSRRLLISALDCFAVMGFDGTSTREIAQGAGMSPAGLYVHYRSKGDILFEISRLGHEHNYETVAAKLVSVDGPRPKLQAFVESFVAWHARYHTMARVTQYELKSLQAEQLATVGVIRRRFRADIETILESGVASGEFEVGDPHGTARAILSLGIDVARWFAQGGPLGPDDVGALYADLALRMVERRTRYRHEAFGPIRASPGWVYWRPDPPPGGPPTAEMAPMNDVTFDYSGRTVIITGAGRGIGREVARRFRESGAETFLIDVDEEVIQEAAREAGGHGIRADVTDTAQVESVIEQVVGETGRVDVLINNAGILRDRMLWKLSDEDWDSVLAVHLGGTFRFTRACVPHFRERQFGRVINITSYTGLRGNVGQAAYAAAKAGIIGFTKTAAKELAHFGVTVNAISPNAATRMIESIPKDRYEESVANTPLGRYAEPAEMAAAMMFLGSESAGYITGVVLPVDGGISI